jgi:hypothetical protein
MGKPVPDTLQSLQKEMERLRWLVGELRTLGHAGLATAIEKSLQELVSDIGHLTGPATEQPVTQQQQQVQPSKADSGIADTAAGSSNTDAKEAPHLPDKRSEET